MTVSNTRENFPVTKLHCLSSGVSWFSQNKGSRGGRVNILLFFIHHPVQVGHDQNKMADTTKSTSLLWVTFDMHVGLEQSDYGSFKTANTVT